MIKLLSIILAFMCFVAPTNIRVAQGEVTSQTYIEDNYIGTHLTTTDGEEWVVENYTAPIGDEVLIIYDKHDNSTIYDDEIMYIIHFTSLK